MKKIYLTPATEVTKVELSKMVATSIGIGESIDDASAAEGRDTFFDELLWEE